MIQTIKKSIGWLLIFGGSWFIFLAATIWSYGVKDHAQQADCIIVLGAAAYHKNPSPVFKERISHAISLYNQGLASKIIFTGGYGNGAYYAESEVGANHAISQGVAKADILTESQSRSTLDNLIEAKALMNSNGLTTAIIVSDPLHLKRASILADDLAISAVTSPTPTSRYLTLKTKSEFLLREMYFYNKYIFSKK